MLLTVTVKPGSKKTGIERETPLRWIVRVREPALDGRANEALLRAIAEELDLPVSRVSLHRGGRSRQKIVAIPDGAIATADEKSI